MEPALRVAAGVLGAQPRAVVVHAALLRVYLMMSVPGAAQWVAQLILRPTCLTYKESDTGDSADFRACPTDRHEWTETSSVGTQVQEGAATPAVCTLVAPALPLSLRWSRLETCSTIQLDAGVGQYHNEGDVQCKTRGIGVKH
mmetsp:Transcript_124835/g.364604  ORF Transcript_124835/g.364604 Transcript_124835/m.364604 type:complete len:143 (-) Transcript_124835:1462-1890(-)